MLVITDFEKNNYIIAIHKEAAWVFGPKQFWGVD